MTLHYPFQTGLYNLYLHQGITHVFQYGILAFKLEVGELLRCLKLVFVLIEFFECHVQTEDLLKYATMYKEEAFELF